MSVLSNLGEIASNPSLGVARQVGLLFVPREYTLLTQSFEITIDTVIQEEHSSDLNITKYAVENGADMTDHFIVNPITFRMTGLITDIESTFGSTTGLIDKGINYATDLFAESDKKGESGARSQLAWKELKRMQQSGEFVTYGSNIELFKNMLITNLSVSQNNDTSLGIRFNMTLEEVFIAESVVEEAEGVYVGSEGKGDPATAINMASVTDTGKTNPSEVTETSALKAIFNYFAR